ncbi:TonB-dependent receptor [Porticoccaceae bacterium]|nr:TonB-dependent receptor [Porticoccaceae bacterium]
MTNLPRLNKKPPMPQQQPCKAASATVSNTPSKIPTKTLSQTLSKTKPPHKTSAPNTANTPDKTNSSKNKPQINSGFFLPTHYKRCKATSGNNAVNRLVGILSIVCLLLGTVSATANTAQQQHDSGSNGNAPSNPEALNKATSATLAHEFFISIPPLNAAEALNRLAKQTGAQLLYSYEKALTRKAHPVVGQYAVMDALTQLLKGSGLEGSLSNKGAITISDSEKVAHHNQRERINMNNKTIVKKTLLATVVGLFAVGGVSAQDQNEAASQQLSIDEIIVTATKRNTSLQDTAMAISALSGDTIVKRGLVGMDDYLRTLPGISMQDRGAGQNSVVIRGLSGDPQTQAGSAGIYFGETPLSGFHSASTVGDAGNLDIKLVDIERIEVLRGPQGTLYGSDSMAGTVRAIPVAPNLEKMEGSLATRFSQTGEKGGDNTMVQAVLNIPLIEDKLAVRAVAYQFDNSGYIENVAVSQPLPGLARTTGNFGGVAADRDDVGNDQYTGFRLTTLWQPTDELDVTLSYLQQDIAQDGYPEVSLNLDGDYQQRRINTGVGGSSYELLESDVDITSLVINYDLGWGALTSASSWVDYASRVETDLTFFSVIFEFAFPDFVDRPYASHNSLDAETFTQEVRLVSNLDGPFQYVAGFYYSDKEEDLDLAHSWTGAIALDPGIFIQYTTGQRGLEQTSFFGELSYELSDQLTATVGGRHYDYTRTVDTEYELATLFTIPNLSDIEDQGQLYKANLSYTPTEDMLIYTQWSEGYRPGSALGENPGCTAAGIPTPDKLNPDTTENIELGFKSSFADNRITFNAALYRINWENIPVIVNLAPNCSQSLNAGEAKSEGVEIELQAQLSENLRTDLSASYGEATLVGDSNIGNDGDNLPGSADFNLSLAVQYDFMLANHDSFARIDYTYISEYFSTFSGSESSATPTPSGDFGQINLKAGIQFDQISLDLFVNNATNDDGLTWVDNVTALVGGGEINAIRIRPRTVGLNLSYEF